MQNQAVLDIDHNDDAEKGQDEQASPKAKFLRVVHPQPAGS
jgi:hypothetical protein